MTARPSVESTGGGSLTLAPIIRGTAVKIFMMAEEAAKLTDGQNFSCGVCLETHKEPKVLPCCHTFCKSCLDGLVTDTMSKKGGGLKCPECRAEHEVPDNGTEGFLTDYSLATSSTNELNCRSSSGSRSGRVCGECEGGEL